MALLKWIEAEGQNFAHISDLPLPQKRALCGKDPFPERWSVGRTKTPCRACIIEWNKR